MVLFYFIFGVESYFVAEIYWLVGYYVFVYCCYVYVMLVGFFVAVIC
jgi:hypothetical protein